MNTTILIPIHKIDADNAEYVKTAIDSIIYQTDKKFQVMYVVSSDVDKESLEFLHQFSNNNFQYEILINQGETDYQSQINYAANHVTTPFFSILQLDDELLPNYILNVNEYIEKVGADCFTTITYQLDDKNNFIGFANEAVWAINHMTDFGQFDLTNTFKHSFVNYSLHGLTINKDKFLQSGLLKKSMKHFHDFEFLLRVLFKGYKVITIPKICYKHVNGREGSLHDDVKQMSNEELKFWYELAKKEYKFDFDRNLTYSVQ